MKFASIRPSLSILAFLGLLSGCSALPLGATASKPPAEERFAGFPAEAQEDVTDPALLAARDQADRLAAEIAHGASASASGGPPVRWIDSRHPSEREPVVAAPVRPQTPMQVPIVPPAPLAPVAAVEPTKPNEPTALTPDASAPPVDPKAIARVLMQQIRQSDDPALTKAINAAALSVVSGERTLSDAILTPLNPQQRQAVTQYHNLLMKLTDQIAAGETQMDARQINEQITGIMGNQPITIRTAELCRRVDNFGVFEPFANRSFQAGREQKMIVYIELDYFESVKIDDDHFEVRLAQEIVLYNESDGLPVWRAPRETIVDKSRNKRRDFFTVKMIRLPENLGVGKFQLKVNVEDLNGKTQASSSIPIHVVTDPTFASKAFK